MGIKTVPQPPYGPDLAPCDFWLVAKLSNIICLDYELQTSIELIKENVFTLKKPTKRFPLGAIKNVITL